ncbi:hypothetical protein [Flavobacterium reichenbachii]|uniref:Uncharacterized protein n=1 Tax=Flavobacterium reichenbachii TaxID=362418 RepID=A0A085ZQI9_9FLAO|nr:hypothetical protein [Flavobacterium reichenbachii]KFF06703.1 hypothetical protein IW19_14845 [Flavobacterium reichenbachii]OXB18693.1 hypothetical protein B0A68_01360 [Flavobacterium reichenbachii]
MEPNNFEKDFREKLNQRKIEPSDKAWDRLDAMLSIAEEKKPKKNRKWLYIAASFVGILLVGSFFFNQNKSTIETPINVVVEKETVKESIDKTAHNNVDSVKAEIAVSEKISNKTLIKEQKQNKISNKNIQNQSNPAAESSIIIKNDQENQSINNQTVIAENSKKENSDQLLKAAEHKVLAENGVKKSKIKINASDLLNQVDGELELSFREKVITKVNKNFQEVKVALSNRNQQE